MKLNANTLEVNISKIRHNIKNGSIIECRNKERFLYVDECLLNISRLDGSHLVMQYFDENLNNIGYACESPSDWDIVKVNNFFVDIEFTSYIPLTETLKGKWTWIRKGNE